MPKPYQDPHPPLFQPFSVSENTIRYTAQSGIVPWILVSYPPDFQRLCRTLPGGGGQSRPQARLGESVGAFRAVHFGRTEEEAVELLRDTNYAGFNHYFGGFGFWEAFRTPEDAENIRRPFTPLPPAEWTLERMRNVKYALAGTADQVKTRDRGSFTRSAARANSNGSAGSSIRASCRGTRRCARSSCSPSTSFRRSVEH